MASDPAISYLKDLGVTAVELMPVHHHVDDRHLVERGLSNYWGYNPMAFFALDIRYSSSGPGEESVRSSADGACMHSAGLEVILDVVYNHTGEGNQQGPPLPAASTVRLLPAALPRIRVATWITGCGNTLHASSSRTRLIMDSLRYWVEEMHVDGFRFDLARPSPGNCTNR